MSVTVQPNTIMNESSPSDATLVELLSLTVIVNRLGATIYRNHLDGERLTEKEWNGRVKSVR